MDRYDPNDKTSRRWAAAATALYALALALAFLLVTIGFSVNPLPESEGILINFGMTESGEGSDDLQSSQIETTSEAASAKAAEPSETMVAENGEIELPATKPMPTSKSEHTAQPSPAQPSVAAEQARQVNRKALFPGRTVESSARSEGNSTGAGNQGDPSGSPTGEHDGLGQGMSGDSYDLSGRSVIGALPKPKYMADVSGKVIIDVTVDASGRVTSAEFHPRGSTTSNARLVTAAREAARKARFSESESPVQGGTITYVFKMN